MAWLWIALLSAEPVSPFSISLEQEIEDQVLSQLQPLTTEERAVVLTSFEEKVFLSARIHYELGLQYNQVGDISSAEDEYRKALRINPKYVPALYDLAEILLLRGDIDSVEEAKRHLTTLQDEGQHWVVSYRLAQIAASEEDSERMERQFKRALREGMPSQILVDDKIQWQRYLQNSNVALSMELLLSALGHEAIWKILKPN